MEYRSFSLADADLKGRRFRGRALVYGRPSPLPTADGRTIHERIERGAFAETTVPLFREHKPELLLARNSVRLTHGTGLDVAADLLDTPTAEEARALVEAGELRGLSIGFLPTGDGFRWERKGAEIHRALPLGRLFEISLVAIPAYEGTSAAVRSLTIPDAIPGGRDTERWSRLLGAITRT